MSGGKIFVETLKKIAYPKANQLNGEHFDWWFDIGDEKKFVEWFCNSINEQNVLTVEELNELEKLKSKDCLLDQKALDQALETRPKDAETKYGNLSEMTMEKLEEEVKALQLIRNLKIQRRNKQQLMASGIHHMPMRLRDEEEESAKLLRETQELLAAENAKLNITLLKVIEEVQQLSAMYSSGSERRPGQPIIFLSQLVLDNYLQQEEQCTAALTEYTKKQLFKGIAELVESSDIEKFQLVDLTSQPIQGECNEVRKEHQQQMARIQAAYTSSQRQLILAKAKEQSTKARLQCMEQLISSIRNRKVIDDVNGAKAKKNSLTKELIPINVQVEHLINKELPDLIVENAQLLNMPVVKGNFDLQMSRQDYYTSKQDQVASQLIRQKTRFELLQLAYEMELCKHRDVHRQLENLTAELEQSRGDLIQRSEMLSDHSLSPSSKQRNIIDSSDTSTVRLCRIFDRDNKQQLFRTYSGLEQEVSNLQQEDISLKDQLGATMREQSYLRSALESDIEKLRGVMYSGSKQLLLRCEDLTEPLQKLECQLQRLPQIIGNIADDIKSKRQMLMSNLNLKGERVLYVYFFQDPDLLKKIVEDLERKIRAQNIGLES